MNKNVVSSRCLTLLGLLVGVASLFPRPAQAIPAFARKYKLQCQNCHSVPPRLTAFGYAFQRAGYRLQANEPKSDNIDKVLSAIAEMHAQNTTPGSAGDRGFDVGDVELQAGSAIGKNMAARGILQLHPDSGPAVIDELWVQYNSAPSKNFWTVRAGQLPILSGIRQSGLTTLTVTDPSLLGTMGGLDGSIAVGDIEKGIELSGTTKGFTGRFSWLNGIDESGDGTVPLGGRRGNDFVFQAEKLLDKRGSSISGFYYHGRQPITSVGFDNQFSRGGVFANHVWYLKMGENKIPALSAELLGGWIWGKDIVDAAGTSAHSRGGLIEADLYAHNRTAYILRYDTIRNSDVLGSPLNVKTNAVTFGIARLPSKTVRLGLDVQHQSNPGVTTLIGSVKLMY